MTRRISRQHVEDLALRLGLSCHTSFVASTVPSKIGTRTVYYDFYRYEKRVGGQGFAGASEANTFLIGYAAGKEH